MSDETVPFDPDLEHQYEIEPWTINPAETRADLSRRSQAATSAFGERIDLAYGDDPRHRLDLAAPSNAPAPALIFIHGGYWQGSSKEERRFPAPALQAHGAAFVPIEYRLAPAVTIAEIVDDVRRAIAWLYENADEQGIDRDRLFVTGNSAGGHLTGMALAAGWQKEYGMPEDVVKGGCAVSGLFELSPLLRIKQRETLHLTVETVAKLSPINHLPRSGTPLIVSWGGRESDEFKRQSAAYIDACTAAGVKVSVVDQPDDDHFSIMGAYGDPSSNLFQAIAGQMGLTPA